VDLTAKTGCHRECPGASDDECPSGMSCFAESLCTQEGVPIQEEVFVEGGMHCGRDYADAENCAITCESDADCVKGTNCYWVECGSGGSSNKETKGDDVEEIMNESDNNSDSDETLCSPEVFLCPTGHYVARAPQLNCEFYPCPKTNIDESSSSEEATGTASGEEGSSESAPAAASDSSSEEEGAEPGSVEDFYDGLGATPGSDSLGSDWGRKPLTHACQAGGGDCGMCEGDCNSDDDCLDGLICFSRGQGQRTEVPGCVSGGVGDKAGMDYCYMEAPPTTATTTTTSTTTTTTTTPPAPQGQAWVDELVDVSSPGVELYYARECSIAVKCGECEGDCDVDSHCMGGLKCFSRDDGSVNAVPGCVGLGTPGMDYCYDPDSPTFVVSTGDDAAVATAADPSSQSLGCTAEVRLCPGGLVVYQDPTNNCQFPPCGESETDVVSLVNTESFYCGFSLDQVNGDCHNSKPCPSGDSGVCDGLEVCIQDTNCGNHQPTTTTSTAATTAMAADSCDDLCLTIPPAGQDFCPTEPNLPNCLGVPVGEFCESDGECGTDDKLDNCNGTFDIYFRVLCDGSRLSQGQIMRATGAPTSSPSLSPTTADPTASPMSSPTTASPTISPEAAVDNSTATNTEALTVDNKTATNTAALNLPQSSTNESYGNNVTQSPSTNSTQSQSPATGFSYDRSPQPQQNNTEATTDSSESSTDTTGLYWFNPSTEFKWDFDSPSSAPPQPCGATLSLLVGLSSCIVFAVELFLC